MSKLREKISEGKEFVVTCEFVPGRGSRGRSIDESIEFGKSVLGLNLPIHAISITDNPGGNPAISPDVLGAELNAMGLEALIHFSCTDANRNLIESRAYSLARSNINNILALTGDYPISGYQGMAKPIFDMDSVQLVRYLKEMNEGLEIPGRKKGTSDRLPKTDFYIGCVVSPFKKNEAELITQFFKLEKKIAAGADFIIPQLGYDIRKFAEIVKYLKYRKLTIPILGNVYVVSRPVARIMNKGLIPGCVVTDDLLKKIEEESNADDKGKRARLERAAKLMAIFRGLKFSGVHIGGFGLKTEDFEYIIKHSEEIAGNWREYIPEFRFNQKNEFYLFPDDPELTFDEDKCIPVKVRRKVNLSPYFLTSKIFHRTVFTEGTIGYHIVKIFYRLFDKIKFLGSIAYFFEKIIKSILFDCQECGDCALFDLSYLCPMSKCAKNQRNGPCGGSRDGMCEADEKKPCVWTIAYNRFSASNKLEYIRKEYIPPVNHALSETSSWANFFMGRDHTSKKSKGKKNN